MSAGTEYEFSSSFDAMLDHDRKRLDQLYRGPPDSVETSAPPRPAKTRRAPSDPQSILDDRFAGRWRHEIVERRHAGDHMAVRCRLTVAGEGIDVTRAGRAPIEQTSVRPEIVATADGIPFSFRSEDVAGDDGAVEDATRRAITDALAKCVAAI